jgi:uncharacterized protein with FMN-binding domain
MNRVHMAAALSAGALALPVANAVAATRNATSTTTAKKIVTKKVSGTSAEADRWGTVTVTLTARVTTSGTKKTVKYLDLGGQYSYHTDRSQYIMSQSLPMLRQEFLKAQSANIQMVSGATDTSQAFMQSLQSALNQLRK